MTMIDAPIVTMPAKSPYLSSANTARLYTSDNGPRGTDKTSMTPTERTTARRKSETSKLRSRGTPTE